MGALPHMRFKNNLLMPLCRTNINCRKKICERERKPCLTENKSKRKKKLGIPPLSMFGVIHNFPHYIWNQPPSMFGKWANTSNLLIFQLNLMKLQLLQMQFKKKTMQSSTFSFPCGIQLIISLKIFVRFNWENNKFGGICLFPKHFFWGEGGCWLISKI